MKTLQDILRTNYRAVAMASPEGVHILCGAPLCPSDLTEPLLMQPGVGSTTVRYVALLMASEVVRLQRIIDNAVSSMDALHAAAQKD